MKTPTTLDTTIINLSYTNLKITLSFMEIMRNSIAFLDIDWEKLTRPQKERLKDDIQLTSDGVNHMLKAQKYFKMAVAEVEAIEQRMDAKTDFKNFDLGTIGSLELQAVELVYTMLTEGSLENTKKIHTYLHKFKWPEELKSAYDSLMNQRNQLAREYNERNKKEIENGKLQPA